MAFDAATLAKIITSGGVQYRQNAIAWIFSCPRCLKKDKLYIRKRDGRFVCWVCKETERFSGHAEWALRELYDIPLKELQDKLYGGDIPDQLSNNLVLEFDDIWQEGDNDTIDSPTIGVMWHPEFVGPHQSAFADGARYLHSRGLTIQHVLDYDIRYHPAERRVIIPVKVGDTLIGWQARYIGATEQEDPETGYVRKIPKILTSDSLRDSGGQYLMFQNRLVNSPHAVLMEGPFDGLKAHLCGGNTVSMGKAVTARQIETILSYGVRTLYLGLDPDAGEEIARLLHDAYQFDEVYLMQPPAHREDHGAATPEEVLEQKERAPQLSRGALIFSLGSQLAY